MNCLNTRPALALTAAYKHSLTGLPLTELQQLTSTSHPPAWASMPNRNFLWLAPKQPDVDLVNPHNSVQKMGVGCKLVQKPGGAVFAGNALRCA